MDWTTGVELRTDAGNFLITNSRGTHPASCPKSIGNNTAGWLVCFPLDPRDAGSNPDEEMDF
jgi:hypothetical protein